MSTIVIYDASEAAGRQKAHRAIERQTAGVLVMTIEEQVNLRTLRQNKMLWAIYENDVVPALARAGICQTDKDGAHYLMRMQFYFKTITQLHTGEEIKVPKTTTKMSRKAFTLYVDNIVRHLATDLQWVVELPGDYEELCGGAPRVHRAVAPKEVSHAA